MSAKEKTFPCLGFKVDLLGGFGNCKCGFSQPDHRPEKRKQLKEMYLRANPGGNTAEREAEEAESEEELEDIDDENDEPCEKFVFDATMPYNTCSCGFTKDEHNAAKVKREQAKAAKRKAEIEKSKKKSPRQLAMEKGVPCPTFEVNVANSTGFAVCLCGFSRQDHNDFKASPEVWVKKKAELTEPKPFI